ncbi:ferrochelatase [Kribbella capetownensis]|uniref:Coproporphyrin III ferrochelatase n=1 Tax=Kribbella capetownensis TaxID=1572659 RepID=A0A4R0JWX2_9ACTN|nr:ferrochelatase [Kribbella capetownensis]TCC49786.1 ferrochelatase [Kribbella capetownensis]
MPLPQSPAAVPYDAVLLLSFGGPEKPEDVLPFLQNVTRGRGIPDERLKEVGEHYYAFGGKSPINDQNRALLEALRASFDEIGLDLPIYWGNRNWAPYLTDTMRQMAADGIRRAVVIVTSAYPSYSGCRQYRENLEDAAKEVPDAPRIDKLRHYANHPGFVGSFVESTAEALGELPEGSAIAYVTHSIPAAMNATSGPDGNGYVDWHLDVAAEITAALERRTGKTGRTDLVYCSRSGPPQVPWLEPDVNDHLESLAAEGVPGVAVVPIGFVSDHMEVIYDLDTEAAKTAEKLGLPMARAATPGTDPQFVSMLRDLVVERAAAERGEEPARPCVGKLGPGWDDCRHDCCPPLRRPTAKEAV